MPEEWAVQRNVEERGEEFEDQRGLEVDELLGFDCDGFGENEPDAGGEDGDEESGDGADCTDGDEGSAGCDRGFETDDGAGCSAERWGGQKIGDGGVDAVSAAGEVVAELMGDQNADQGEREGQAEAEVREIGKYPGKGDDVGLGRNGESSMLKVDHVAHAIAGG